MCSQKLKIISKDYVCNLFITNMTTTKKVDLPWVDKYRPHRLDDIVEQTEVIKVLKNTVKTGELPHLLFYGPPGTGKTSTILAIAIELFGYDKVEERVIELNASDDRGINVVRDKISAFAKRCIGTPDPNYPSPPYKILILDEADAMTSEAQAALREVMEKTSKITRFCLICNYINQIIPPIASRCLEFRFKPLENVHMNKRLMCIAKRENIDITPEIANRISEISRGDARRAIMILQYIQYVIKTKGSITESDVDMITGTINRDVIDSIWKNMLKNTVIDTATLIKRNAYPISEILDGFRFKVINSKLSDESKSKIMLEICNSEKCLSDGSNEYLQILNVLATIKSFI
jgi:replication factor C subunit 2/4